MTTIGEVEGASARLRPYVRRTPLERSARLSRELDCEVLLKLECQQLTGSFKLRGAYNKLLQLGSEECARGVLAASTGNHGLAVAHAAARLGIEALVYVPRTADPAKLEGIASAGAELRFAGEECAQAELAAREHAARDSKAYISPYNDADVIAGQGSIAIELLEQEPELAAIVVAVGGGGLAAGIGTFLQGQRPEIDLIGVSPHASAAMHAALKAGRIVEIPHAPTLSDATAGGLEPQALTFPACKRVLRELLLVEEEAILDEMRELILDHHLLVEGAAACALAGLRQVAQRYRGRSVAVVLCGANVSRQALRRVLAS